MSELDSKISTNSVIAGEELIRILYHPSHIGENNTITPAAISIDDLTKNGVSVDRKQLVNKPYVESNIAIYVSRKPEERKLAGFGVIKHQDILNITDDSGEQVFRVEADPTPANDAHALIFCNNRYSPSVVRKFRKNLIDLIRLFVTLDEALA